MKLFDNEFLYLHSRISVILAPTDFSVRLNQANDFYEKMGQIEKNALTIIGQINTLMGKVDIQDTFIKSLQLDFLSITLLVGLVIQPDTFDERLKPVIELITSLNSVKSKLDNFFLGMDMGMGGVMSRELAKHNNI